MRSQARTWRMNDKVRTSPTRTRDSCVKSKRHILHGRRQLGPENMPVTHPAKSFSSVMMKARRGCTNNAGNIWEHVINTYLRNKLGGKVHAPLIVRVTPRASEAAASVICCVTNARAFRSTSLLKRVTFELLRYFVRTETDGKNPRRRFPESFCLWKSHNGYPMFWMCKLLPEREMEICKRHVNWMHISAVVRDVCLVNVQNNCQNIRLRP